ncbi:hypothetical protein [Streptomyces sp. bgisy034]|uniref:hypothetical protein n=1 Tax=Streptomyces sp. bgisy034 TaxID=3413774 RepID=UPI003EB8A937
MAELTIRAQVLQAADRTPFYKQLAGPVKAYLEVTFGGDRSPGESQRCRRCYLTLRQIGRYDAESTMSTA